MPLPLCCFRRFSYFLHAAAACHLLYFHFVIARPFAALELPCCYADITLLPCRFFRCYILFFFTPCLLTLLRQRLHAAFDFLPPFHAMAPLLRYAAAADMIT